MMAKKLMSFQANLDCQTCQQLLPAYVRLELANQPADAVYPQVSVHIETCPTCTAAYFEEFDRQGMAITVAALQTVGQRTAPVAQVLDAHLKPAMSSALTGLFAPVTHDAQRLIATIPIWVSDVKATFGDLATAFGQQITAALLELAAESGNKWQPALRGQSMKRGTEQHTEQTQIELLRLPYPERDLLIVVSIGAVINYQSTLTIQVATLTQALPLSQARVILCDQQGEPLEMRTLDADGLVTFSQLTLATYTVQILHNGQRLEFAVTLLPHP